MMYRILMCAALAGVLAVPAFGQGVDPLIGLWKLNHEKSTSSYPLPTVQILTFAMEGQILTATAEGVDAQGPFKRVLLHIYDGMPHPTTGNPEWDSTAFTRVGNTINAVRFRKGKAVLVGQGVIVPGKTYTFTEEGIDINGQLYHDVTVFDRQ
jgi:hypothetical protein